MCSVCVCVSLTSGEDSGLSVALQVAFYCHEVHGVLGARLQVPQEVLGSRGSHVVGAGLPSPGGPCCQLVPRDHGTGPRPQHQHRVLRGVEEPQVGGGIELWGGKAEHPSASQLNLHFTPTSKPWVYAWPVFLMCCVRAAVGKREGGTMRELKSYFTSTSTPQCHPLIH